MRTAEKAREYLYNIHKMTVNLPDTVATILGLHAAPIRSRKTKGMQDTMADILSQADAASRILDPLDDLAAQWQPFTHEPRIDNPTLFLARHATWAQNNWPAWDDAYNIIKQTFDKLAHLTGYGKETSEHQCPTCRTYLTRTPSNEGYPDAWTCDQCSKAWIVTDGYNMLALSQQNLLIEQDAHVTRSQAATILNINQSTIRSWIKRGKLTETNGKISLNQANQLKERSK